MKESMKALCADIEAAGEKELARAAQTFGPVNHSSHESYAVIKEEFEEAQTEGIMFERLFEFYWKAVKRNDEVQQRKILAVIVERSRNAATEWTQAYAMCRKAMDTLLQAPK